ncbi:hypothetical protein NM208_g7142 [Fusarium decemcellulare]|uniref:Uncharacterized protein n=1 Tax=Fusarium decemcellulare TaxID=57161 RepID=A0ACC1SAC3_9HYPO|nr:hypothetical protein NM208_g7142 [Fusarium decemcellulare]
MSVYFDSNWAILSTIGLITMLFSVLILGITKLSYLSVVPLVVSAAGAIANGLSYYGQYENTQPTTSAAVWAVADVLWMIQEAGLSFYSYAIVTRILPNREGLIYVLLFWGFMMCILVARMILLAYRAKSILGNDSTLKSIVNGAHIGYFVSLALVECLSAFFLLRTFATARKTSAQASLKTDLFKHLARSTEVRLALLALIGVARAVTFFFQPPIRGGSSVSSQIDTFLYTLECMFPVMLLIDLLASKIAFTQGISRHHSELFIRDIFNTSELTSSCQDTSYTDVIMKSQALKIMLASLLAPPALLAATINPRQNSAGAATVDLSKRTGQASFLGSGFIYGFPDNGRDADNSIPDHFLTDIKFRTCRAGGAQIAAEVGSSSKSPRDDDGDYYYYDDDDGDVTINFCLSAHPANFVLSMMQYTVAIGLGLASLAAAVPTSIPTLVPTPVSTQVPGASAPADPNNYWQDVIDPWGQYGQVPDTVKRANIEVVGDEGGNSTDYRIGEELDISSDELLEHAKRATVDDYVGLIPGCDKDPSYAKKPGWPPYHGVKIPKDGNDDLCTTGKGDAKCWTEYFLVEAAIEYFSWKKSGSAVNCPAEAGSSCSIAVQSLRQSCSLTGTAETSGWDFKILEGSLSIGLDPKGSSFKGEGSASMSISHSWSTTKQNQRQSCAADTAVATCEWTNPTGQKQNLCPARL